jgi:hypothetical protein
VILVGILGFSIITALYFYIRHRLSSKIDWQDIDQEIKPLLKMLHAYGVLTNESCSGHGCRLGHIEIADKSYEIEYDARGKRFCFLIIDPYSMRKNVRDSEGDA